MSAFGYCVTVTHGDRTLATFDALGNVTVYSVHSLQDTDAKKRIIEALERALDSIEARKRYV